MQPFRDSSADLENGPALVARAARDGYLFFRGLLPRSDVFAARRAILPSLDAAGWLERTSPDDERAIAKSGVFVDDAERDVGELVCRHAVLPEVQRLQHHPRLLGLFARLFGDEVLPLPRILLRYIFPQQTAHTTPQHQDYPHVQGTDRFYTAWIPLGDCGGELGGVKVATGSHASGVLPLEPSLGAGAMCVPGDFQEHWRGSDMSCGDVLIFNALTVHAGRPNVSERMRLSIDLRYQPLSEPITEEWLHPHRRLLSWEQLYADLDDDTWTYYWRKLKLTVVQFDQRYYDARDRLSLELAAAGDRRAQATLRRIVNRDPDPDKRARAAVALRSLEPSA